MSPLTSLLPALAAVILAVTIVSDLDDWFIHSKLLAEAIKHWRETAEKILQILCALLNLPFNPKFAPAVVYGLSTLLLMISCVTTTRRALTSLLQIVDDLLRRSDNFITLRAGTLYRLRSLTVVQSYAAVGLFLFAVTPLILATSSGGENFFLKYSTSLPQPL